MTEDFVIEDGVLKEYKGTSDGIVIPAGVRIISDKVFCGNRNIVQVDMTGSDVQQIGSHAFQDCVNLVNVKTSENLKFIGGSAFRGCVSLAKIYLPKSMQTIEECAFMQCERLKEVQIGMNTGIRQGTGGLAADGEYIHNGGAPLNIGEYAFSGCENLVSMNLTARLHMLGERAFNGCGKLAEVILYLEEDTSISGNAFIGCSDITIKYRGCKMSSKWWKEKFAKGAKVKIKYNY